MLNSRNKSTTINRNKSKISIISKNLNSILSKSKSKSKLNPEFLKKLSFDTIFKISIRYIKNKLNTINDTKNLTEEELIKIINIFNDTRHGIEYYEYSTFNPKIKSTEIKGGLSLTFEDISSNEISNFCRNYKGTPGQDNHFISRLQAGTLPQNTDYVNIKNFIINNNTPYSSQFVLPNLLQYDYFSSDYSFANKLLPDRRTFTRSNTYFEYNKQLIMGYNLPQIEFNQNNYINIFIQQQQQYLNSLNDKKKNIVKDYIHPNSYTLLHAFINNGYGSGFINNYKRDNRVSNLNHEMGNAFCDYIEEYINLSGITHVDINSLKSKVYFENADEFYNQIPEDIWCIILLQYLEDLNNIILEAPPVEHIMITYRGSSTDYINIQTQTATGIDIFISNRISSFSFNYDAAKEFYDRGTRNNEKTLYRVAITPGSKVLFVTSLAPEQLKDEMEILTPINQQFHAPGNWNRINAWNSFKNKNNFCLFDEDKINSKDLILLNI
jgi:hypothetical protein